MNYCGNCANPITLKIPDGDDRERHCCENCGSIHYFNPRIIVASIPLWQDKIMLCKRGIEPRLGYWTLPGGFMELGETTEEGAIRETWEETRAKIDIQHLHGVYNLPQINQVYFVYLAKMQSADFEFTQESTDIKLFKAEDIPWDDMAFAVLKQALQQYVDKATPVNHAVHHDDIRFQKKG